MSRKSFFAATLLLGLAVPGCGLPLADVSSGPLNTCESNSDCAAGGVCASVGSSKACVATRADLPGLLLEIRPAADSSFGANVTYIVDAATQGVALQDTISSGQVRRFD